MKSNYIHIEGMNLGGKSTVCRELASRFTPQLRIRRDALYDKNIMYITADARRRGGTDGPENLSTLYLAAVSEDIKHFTWPSAPTLRDSTILLRSMVFYRVIGMARTADAFEALLPRYPKFSRTVVLTASIESRIERLAMRNDRNPGDVGFDDLLVLRDPKLFLEMEQLLVRTCAEKFDARRIDTTHCTVEAIVDAIIGFL